MLLIAQVYLFGVNIRIMVNFRQRYYKNLAKEEKFRAESLHHKISREKNLKYRFQNNIISANFGNEIILSPSGQAKMDSLNSCLSLVRNDFIVF